MKIEIPKITLQDIKDIKIRRKPTFNDILRIILGIGIIIFGFVCATGVVPDTKESAPIGLVIFGCLFMIWGFYPICSKKERSTSQVLEAFDRMRVMPETPGQLRKVRIPGTNIRAGLSKEELSASEILEDTNDASSNQTDSSDTNNK